MLPIGPDRGWSWVIVICCAYLNLAFFGLVRSSGVMYVAFLHNFGVTREEASWPFSLCSATFQLSGPVASLLMHYLTLRKSCIIGSTVATLGVVGCYFAENITWINIFYGVVHGFGFGLVATLVPVIVNQYFVRHRATALGMAFSGGALSSFVFPPAIEYLLEKYDLPGSFLILGGVIMNTIVASSLLRAPPWLNKRGVPLNKTEDQYSGVRTSVDFVHDPHVLPDSFVLPVKSVEYTSCNQRMNSQYCSKNNLENGDSQQHEEECHVPNLDDDQSKTLATENISGSQDRIGFPDTMSQKLSINSYQKEFHDTKETLPFLDASEKQIAIIPSQKNVSDAKNNNGRSELMQSVIDVFRNPMFFVLLMTLNIFFTGTHCFFMVIIDFGRDKGISEQDAIYVLFAFSVTDLSGRMFLGWITDRSFIKARNMLMINMASIGLLLQLYPLVNSLLGIVIVATLHGLFAGANVPLLFVLHADYIGMKRLPVALGLASFINGISTFVRPPMIGLFRDVIGTYNWMFHFLGICYLVMVTVWFLEPWFVKKQLSKQKMAEEISRINEKDLNSKPTTT